MRLSRRQQQAARAGFARREVAAAAAARRRSAADAACALCLHSLFDSHVTLAPRFGPLAATPVIRRWTPWTRSAMQPSSVRQRPGPGVLDQQRVNRRRRRRRIRAGSAAGLPSSAVALHCLQTLRVMTRSTPATTRQMPAPAPPPARRCRTRRAGPLGRHCWVLQTRAQPVPASHCRRLGEGRRSALQSTRPDGTRPGPPLPQPSSTAAAGQGVPAGAGGR